MSQPPSNDITPPDQAHKPTDPTPLASAQNAERTTPAVRNPFGEKDVFDPDGADVRAFAAKTVIRGGDADPNAELWPKRPVSGRGGTVEGEWASRWTGGTAGDKWNTLPATAKLVGDRLYILFHTRADGNQYLIEAVRATDGRFVGRFVNLRSPKADNSPWVGRLVGAGRIDGAWRQGRWDLRRTTN